MSKQRLGQCAILAFLLAPALFWAEDLVHTLKKGETLYSISRQYQVPAELIMSHNGIANPDRLQAGQKIKIPGIYTVQKGDTLYAIARKFGVTADELARINKIPKDGTLKAGDRLCVPGGAQAVAAAGKGSDPTPAKGDDAGQKLPPGVSRPLDPRTYDNRTVDKSLIWPVSVIDISYLSGKVYGVSITSDKGERVKAIASGKVISAGPYRGFGQVVFVQSTSGYIYVYGGLEKVSQRVGHVLSFGDSLGTLGSDSLSGKAQLYFMVYNKDTPIDPAKAPRGN